jgi:hypothetical protein
MLRSLISGLEANISS